MSQRCAGYWWLAAREDLHFHVTPAGTACTSLRPAASRGFKASTVVLAEGKKGGPFVSQHYDGIPPGAVADFLGRHGISDWKRVGQGWLNLRVNPSVGLPTAACMSALFVAECLLWPRPVALLHGYILDTCVSWGRSRCAQILYAVAPVASSLPRAMLAIITHLACTKTAAASNVFAAVPRATGSDLRGPLLPPSPCLVLV